MKVIWSWAEPAEMQETWSWLETAVKGDFGEYLMHSNSNNTPSMMDVGAGSCTWSDSKMVLGSGTKKASGICSGFMAGTGFESAVDSG